MSSPTGRRRPICALVGVAFLSFSRLSYAQGTGGPDEAASERLERTFTILAADERAHRSFRDVSGIVLAGAAIAGGIALTQENKGSAGPYVLTGVGGLRLLSSGYDILWGRDPYEALVRSVAEMRLARLPEPELLSRIDLQWQTAAKRARVERQRAGILESVIGTGLVVAGLVIAVDQSAFGFSAPDRTVRASALVSVGTILTGLGAADLIMRDPVEVGYEIFRSNSAGVDVATPRAPSFTFGLSGLGFVAAASF